MYNQTSSCVVIASSVTCSRTFVTTWVCKVEVCMYVLDLRTCRVDMSDIHLVSCIWIAMFKFEVMFKSLPFHMSYGVRLTSRILI